MRNPSRLAVIAGTLAVLASLGLALQLALMGLLFTSLGRAWLALDQPPALSQPIAGGERVASEADPLRPRNALGAGSGEQPRAVREPVPVQGTVRSIPRHALVTDVVGAETSRSSQRPSSASDPTIGRLLLLDVRAPAAGPSVTVSGLDLAGPRDLVLWQVNEERRRAARLARTSSRSDGLFELPRLLLPTRAVRLVVTAEGEDPFAAGSAAVLDLEGREPPPPRAWIDWSPTDAESEHAQLRVAPDSLAYALLLGDATGRELARLEIPAVIDPRLAPRPLHFEIDERPLRIAREQSDGRRSEWSAVPTRWLAGLQPGIEETVEEPVGETLEETP